MSLNEIYNSDGDSICKKTCIINPERKLHSFPGGNPVYDRITNCRPAVNTWQARVIA